MYLRNCCCVIFFQVLERRIAVLVFLAPINVEQIIKCVYFLLRCILLDTFNFIIQEPTKSLLNLRFRMDRKHPNLQCHVQKTLLLLCFLKERGASVIPSLVAGSFVVCVIFHWLTTQTYVVAKLKAHVPIVVLMPFY